MHQARVTFGFVVASSLAIAGLSAPAATFHPRLTQVTWSVDIAPVVKRRCAGCHRDGGFGPMPLTTYEQARDWSRAISERTMEGTMPPWPAAAGIGDFANDRSLTSVEIELLEAWAAGGAAEGPATPSLPTPDTEARAPDLILDLPASSNGGVGVTRYTLATAIDRERWFAGWEFQPAQPSRVERAVLGVAGEGPMASWLPPEGAVMFPDGVARRLGARATLTVDVHYRKGTTPAAQGGRVALYIGGQTRHQLRHRLLSCGSSTLAEAIDVVAVEPVLAEAGAMIDAVAHRPDRSVEPLILVRRFLPWYVPTYRYRSAIRLPRGTRIEVRSSAETCTLGVDYVPAR